MHFLVSNLWWLCIFHSLISHFIYSVHAFSSLMVLLRATLDKLVQGLYFGQQMGAWYFFLACQLRFLWCFYFILHPILHMLSLFLSNDLFSVLYNVKVKTLSCWRSGITWILWIFLLSCSMLCSLVTTPHDLTFHSTFDISRCSGYVKVWVLQLTMLLNIEVPFWV